MGFGFSGVRSHGELKRTASIAAKTGAKDTQTRKVGRTGWGGEEGSRQSLYPSKQNQQGRSREFTLNSSERGRKASHLIGEESNKQANKRGEGKEGAKRGVILICEIRKNRDLNFYGGVGSFRRLRHRLTVLGRKKPETSERVQRLVRDCDDVDQREVEKMSSQRPRES